MCVGERNHRGQRARRPPASQRLHSNQHLASERLCSSGLSPQTREGVPTAPSLPWGERGVLLGVQPFLHPPGSTASGMPRQLGVPMSRRGNGDGCRWFPSCHCLC